MPLPSRSGAPDRMAAGPWAMVRGKIATVMVVSATHGLAVPLEGRYPYHIAENGQELVHGRSPLRRIRPPLAFPLKRV
ncbi:hypothetical protein MPL3365_30172 [Mesorhizobium plurifarium]|uniref:Uncharacterized protein n=1 Tax=Mesorhizobium plurifarium TaxID=69974 RepID=A0A090GV19_MESPL|nr:hypothetical protein MPL3365_30172 [Mesorhizobium plurifarium]